MTHEELLDLLRESVEYIDPLACQIDESDLLDRIDAALSSPQAVRTEDAERQDSEVHQACGHVHRDGRICILETVRLVRERTAERDEARSEATRLAAERDRAQMQSHFAGVRADNAERREKARIKERDEARAALAARQDSATEVVEWKMRDIVDYPIQHALLGEAELVVFPNIFEPVSQWHWNTGFMGEASTEADAKAAAIAAARGLR